uniref:Uncharacterized protein n=1 Tax=Oryza meridionalis TaxID=40149 RepID=A0A0E0CEE9_9ORYZ
MQSPLFSQCAAPPVELRPTAFISSPPAPAMASSFLGSPQSLMLPASTSTGPSPDSSAATKFIRMSSQLRSRSTTARAAASSGEQEYLRRRPAPRTRSLRAGCRAAVPYAHLPRARSRWWDLGKNPTRVPGRARCCQAANAKESAAASGSTSSSATATAAVRMDGCGRKRELREAEAVRWRVTAGGRLDRRLSGVEGLDQSTTTATTSGWAAYAPAMARSSGSRRSE